MKFLIEVLVDDDQMKLEYNNKERISEALDFAVCGALNEFKDSRHGRYAATIDYEVRVTVEE